MRLALLSLIFLAACGMNDYEPPKAAAPHVPTSLAEAKAAAQTSLPGPPVGPWGCQSVTIDAPGLIIKLHGANGYEQVFPGEILIQPGATIWISADHPCTWDGVDFYDYVDATWTQVGPISNTTHVIHVYPSAGG